MPVALNSTPPEYGVYETPHLPPSTSVGRCGSRPPSTSAITYCEKLGMSASGRTAFCALVSAPVELVRDVDALRRRGRELQLDGPAGVRGGELRLEPVERRVCERIAVAGGCAQHRRA